MRAEGDLFQIKSVAVKSGHEKGDVSNCHGKVATGWEGERGDNETAFEEDCKKPENMTNGRGEEMGRDGKNRLRTTGHSNYRENIRPEEMRYH